MRRPMLLSAMLTLFLVAGVSLIAGSFLIQPPLPASATADTDVVRRFYAAVNDAIATGDTTALHAVVAPHFVEQDPVPGMRPDRSGLEGYLASLHVTDPDMELVVEAVVAADDRAIARVAVRGGQGRAVLGRAVVGQPDPWGPVDVFRIAGSNVVERWSHTDGLTLVRPIAEVTLDLPAPSPRVVTIERFTIAPGAFWNPPPAGPRLLSLQDGALRVDVEAAAAAMGRSPLPGIGAAVAEGEALHAPQVATLSAGGSSVVPEGAHFAATNVGVEDAQVLVVTFSEPRVPGGSPLAVNLPPGVVGQTLAGGLATDVQVGPAVLTLGQVTLARNARLSISGEDGPTLIAVEAGRLKAATWGRAWLRRGSDGMSVDATEAVMASGDGMLMHQGGLVALQNPGNGPAVVVVLTLRPTE